ncbi:hypothetical protein B9Y76_01615 [Stenotrophomonas maltophilia]|nr:hypothetical protein [Stenotrophomonas maltophilia]OWQ82121.1 hypothetical protein CEE62_03860 [Stenotrophomonas maltophilia]PJL04708.1 hypothetical protein B9Y76_01615 [Stenotrophomonas maltophilia]
MARLQGGFTQARTAFGWLQPASDETALPRSERPHWQLGFSVGAVVCAGDVMATGDSITVAIGAGP